MVRTEVFINNKQVEIKEDIPIPLTFQVADIRNPENKKTNFSKTVTIPGSKTNNALFEAIWDVNYNIANTSTTNFNPDFNPNLKADVTVFVDGVKQFEGLAKLERIRITDEWYKWEYDFTFRGQLYNLLADVANNYLHQLDLDKYDHTLTKTNIQNSWNTSIIKNGSAYVNFTGDGPIGEGYFYPLIDYGLDPVGTWKTTSFFPGIYMKTYIDEIFSYAGWSYSSNFFNSAFFKKLVIPYNAFTLKYSETVCKNRSFLAERTSTQTINSTGSVQSTPTALVFNDDTTDPNNDQGGNYDTATGIATIVNTGVYDLSFRLKCQLRHQPLSSPATLNSQYANFFTIGELQKKVGSTWTTVVNTANQFGFTTLTGINAGDTTAFFLNLDFTNQSLTAGDQFRVAVYSLFTFTTNSPGNPYGSTGGDMYYDILDDSTFKLRFVNNSIIEGDTVEMNNAIPRDIKMTDFLRSVFRLFNLYVDEDKTTPRKLIMEPRDDFYAGGVTRDWSEKIDLSRPIEKEPMGELNFKQYDITYKEDSDYYNEKYKKTYNEIYGRKLYEVQNDFIKETRKLDVIFSPTPLVDQPPSDRIIPRIFQVDQQGNVKPKTTNLRLLIWGGIKQSNPSYTWISSSGTTQVNHYGYAGHLDDPKNPTVDLNIYYPRELYFTTSNYTNNNIFNAYHKKGLDEITDVNSNILRAYFYLTPQDINRLDFRDRFYFEKQYWRLNKIYDYNALSNETTKCEFLLIKDGVPFSSRTIKFFGSPLTQLDDTLQPSFNNPSSDLSSGNSYNTSSQRVLGQDNFIGFDSLDVLIVGSNNRVGHGCRSVAMINSSGCTVFAGMNNVTFINSSGVTATDSNQVWMNNVLLGSPSSGTKDIYADYSATAKDDLVLCHVPVGGLTVTLPTDLTGDKVWTFKHVEGTGNTLTVVAGGLMIDGAPTATTSTLNAVIKIRWNNARQAFYREI